MILAVLETRAGVKFSDKEVYLNVAGGFKISEPAADLAVAVALLSSVADVALPERSIFFGEIGLSGEIRAVSRQDARLKEANKLGFKRAYSPTLPKTKNSEQQKNSQRTTNKNHRI